MRVDLKISFSRSIKKKYIFIQEFNLIKKSRLIC